MDPPHTFISFPLCLMGPNFRLIANATGEGGGGVTCQDFGYGRAAGVPRTIHILTIVNVPIHIILFFTFHRNELINIIFQMVKKHYIFLK